MTRCRYCGHEIELLPGPAPDYWVNYYGNPVIYCPRNTVQAVHEPENDEEEES